MNPYQEKARERFPHGAVKSTHFGWVAALRDYQPLDDVPFQPLDVLHCHLAYERQECERCFGYKTNRWRHSAVDECLDCLDETGKPTGFSPDYRKAQEWAVKLGVE